MMGCFAPYSIKLATNNTFNIPTAMLEQKPFTLSSLRRERTAPRLNPDQSELLLAEITEALQRCEWFTIGVMASNSELAVRALRGIESKYGWQALRPANETPVASKANLTVQTNGVFLKGNQATGTYSLRSETGLGEGLLITGHNFENPEFEGTWGPFPLDFFV